MNWALIDAGTFDYAADAWGYSYGASAEWYQGEWTFRGGMFDLSTVPNSEELDPNFGQFQWVGEIERRYTLWGHPGKIAVTGFFTRARMGTYQNAIALAQMTGGPADIAAVRQYRSRPAWPESRTGDHVRSRRIRARRFRQRQYRTLCIYRRRPHRGGRAGAQGQRSGDGRTTRSALAGIVNGISADACSEFLNDGGLGILVGDGMCRIRVSSRSSRPIICFRCAAMNATLDYQFIVNPAYNRDRGPVSVFGSARSTDQF